MDSLALQQKRRVEVTDFQKSMIIGTILGDGHVLKTTMGYCLRLKHGLKQIKLLEWKHQILSSIATPIKIYQDSCYFRTVTHPVFAGFRNMFYVDNTKIVPSNLESIIDPVALATWIMDDGTNELGHSRSLRINTQCFSLQEHKELQRILQAKFEIITTLNRDRDMYRLRVAKSSMDKLIKLVSPYIIPSMFYKLSP